MKCWNCDKAGHLTKDCRAPKKESTGRPEKKTPGARMVQSAPSQQPAKNQDDPLQYLLSDSDDSLEVRQLRVFDTGSKPQSVRVIVGRVPMDGIVDSGPDITIVGGDMFKRVTAVAKLRKRDFKPPGKTPWNYDQQPFRLDGQIDLDITFEDRTMKSLSGKHAQWWMKVFGSGIGQVHIVYRPGRENTRADALSRNPMLCPDDEHVNLDVQVAQVGNLQDVEISQLLESPHQP